MRGTNGYSGSSPNWNNLSPQPNNNWAPADGVSPKPTSKISTLALEEQINQMPPPNGYSNGSQGNKDDLKNSVSLIELVYKNNSHYKFRLLHFLPQNIISDQELKPAKRTRKRLKQSQQQQKPPPPTQQAHQLDNRLDPNITPLPGFQQAFGSTEIGRFSEVFFNVNENQLEHNIESETEALSLQPWGMGDSLEGPYYNLQIGASVHPLYSDNYSNNIEPPPSNSYFREIRCNEY